jgi:hypothetical protein
MLEVYDVKGRLVDRRDLGRMQAGVQSTPLRYQGLSGIHFYRLNFVNPTTGRQSATLAGKVMLIQ